MSRRFTLCHTADWHLGHRLHGVSREHEHRAFLTFLTDLLVERSVDVLAIAGDVFDSAQPSGEAMALFYRFLAELRARHDTEVFVIAGNHDSPTRLSAPDPVLRSLGVRVVGQVEWSRDEHGARLDTAPLVHPLIRRGERLGWVVTVPFLRATDLPPRHDEALTPDGHLARGWTDVYRQAFDAAVANRGDDEAILVLGHCHVSGARLSEDSERAIHFDANAAMEATGLPLEASYVALGHLHFAQAVGNREHIRYSGSPIPLSIAEDGYRHGVELCTFEGARMVERQSIAVPRVRTWVRIPEVGVAPLSEVIATLERHASSGSGTETPEEEWPWLVVATENTGAHTNVRGSIEDVVRRARLNLLKVHVQGNEHTRVAPSSVADLSSRSVLEVFVQRWNELHREDPSAAVMEAFAEAHSAALANWVEP